MTVSRKGKNTIKVLIESERGWGQQVDEVKYFPTKAKAEAFIRKYNRHNNEAAVPEWYMYARLA